MTRPALDLEVAADAASCRAAAQGTGALGRGLAGLHDGFVRSAAAAPASWRGEAATAFGAAMTTAAGHAETTGRAATGLGRALEAFAGEIDAVVGGMDDARRVAGAAGLAVSDLAIQPPAPAAVPPTAAAERDRASVEYQVALDGEARRQEAFDRAAAIVEAARRREQAATEELTQAATRHGQDLDEVRTVAQTVLSKGAAVVGGAVGSAQGLMLAADKNAMLGTAATAALAGADAQGVLTPEARAALESAQRRAYHLAAQNRFRGELMARYTDRLPTAAQELLPTTLSDVARRATGAARDVPAALDTGIPVLRDVPVVGAAVTVGATALDIGVGHANPVTSIEKAVGGYAAGAAAAGGVDALAAAGIAAGLAVPGPGWVLAGGLVAGTLAAAGVGWVVDHDGDAIDHAVGEGAHRIGGWIHDHL